MCTYSDVELTRIHVMCARAADQGIETYDETTQPEGVNE